MIKGPQVMKQGLVTHCMFLMDYLYIDVKEDGGQVLPLELALFVVIYMWTKGFWFSAQWVMKFRAFNNSPPPTLTFLVNLLPSVQVVVNIQSYIQLIHETFLKTPRTWKRAVMLTFRTAQLYDIAFIQHFKLLCLFCQTNK